jgi:hypothetical protein
MVAPMMENTTPPVMNAMNSLRPLPAVGCGATPGSGTVFCRNRLVRTVICAIVEASTRNG